MTCFLRGQREICLTDFLVFLVHANVGMEKATDKLWQRRITGQANVLLRFQVSDSVYANSEKDVGCDLKRLHEALLCKQELQMKVVDQHGADRFQELLSLRVGAFVDPDAPPPRARDALAQKSRRLVSLRASANNCEKQYALLGYDPDRRIQHFLAACEEVLKRKVRLWDALCEWAAFVGKADVAPLLRIGDFLSGAEVRAAVERAQDELRAVLVLKQDGDQVKSGTNTPAEEK